MEEKQLPASKKRERNKRKQERAGRAISYALVFRELAYSISYVDYDV